MLYAAASQLKRFVFPAFCDVITPLRGQKQDNLDDSREQNPRAYLPS